MRTDGYRNLYGISPYDRHADGYRNLYAIPVYQTCGRTDIAICTLFPRITDMRTDGYRNLYAISPYDRHADGWISQSISYFPVWQTCGRTDIAIYKLFSRMTDMQTDGYRHSIRYFPAWHPFLYQNFGFLIKTYKIFRTFITVYPCGLWRL